MTSHVGVNRTRTSRDLVLVGGGHAHVQVLETLARRAPRDVQLTLVSESSTAYYSGMFPGCLAGLYRPEQTQIELDPLCRWAGARFVRGRVRDIDPESRLVQLEGAPPLRFDLCSVNVGSRTLHTSLPGVEEFAVATRPIGKLLERVQAFEENFQAEAGPPRVVVVGGGAAGVELTFSLRARLRRRWPDVVVCLVDSRSTPLEAAGSLVSGRVRRALEARKIQVASRTRASHVEEGELHLEGGGSLRFDLLIWATGAGAHEFLAKTPLETDDHGFMKVDRFLQSLSSPRVFGAGDCISLEGHPDLPKAGVYAVREGPVLADNLLRVLEGRSPRPYLPQTGFLALLATGDRSAIASWKGLSVEGGLIWKLKDWIDRRFMDRFDARLLGPPPGAARPPGRGEPEGGEPPACRGCGAKVGATSLYDALRDMAPEPTERIRMGVLEGEDAAVLEIPPDRYQVQTVDAFPAFLDDGYLMGRIAVLHAASDLFAMGADPDTALLQVTLPATHPRRAAHELRRILQGATEELSAMGASLVGGHTLEGSELQIGVTMTGLLPRDEEAILVKGALRAGDELVLTKPLGVGAILAAAMRYQARGEWIEGAIESMTRSNQAAIEILRRFHVRAVTDVTGFGLAGHLGEMLRLSQVGARVELDQLPLLPGARDCLELGVLSSLDPENRQAVRDLGAGIGGGVREALLYDPQTSGGLLCGVSAGRGQALAVALHKAGFPGAARVGIVTEGAPRLTAL